MSAASFRPMAAHAFDSYLTAELQHLFEDSHGIKQSFHARGLLPSSMTVEAISKHHDQRLGQFLTKATDCCISAEGASGAPYAPCLESELLSAFDEMLSMATENVKSAKQAAIEPVARQLMNRAMVVDGDLIGVARRMQIESHLRLRAYAQERKRNHTPWFRHHLFGLIGRVVQWVLLLFKGH